jgi:hypothetical protein
MVTITQAVSIGASIATVWAAWADFGNVQDWSPLVAKSYLTSETQSGLGTSRHCDLVPRGEVDETITGWRENAQLVVDVHPGGPIARQQVTIDLAGPHAEESETTVRMTVALELTPEAADRADAMRDTFRMVLRETLAGLRHHLVTGETVTETTALSHDGLID